MQPVATQSTGQMSPAVAVSAGWYHLPYDALGAGGLQKERDRLTYKPKYAEAGSDPVVLYRDMPSRRMMAVPRAYGQARFQNTPVEDRRSLGVPFVAPCPKQPSPNHPAVKDPEQQRKFMDDMLAAAREHHNFIAYADTGSGKTVVALWLAAQLRVKTVILVHLERLAVQWKKEIIDKLGVPEERIGLTRGPKCEWEGKDFVICIMKSLAVRDYPPEFYRSFGLCLIDECHRVGSPLLAKCAPLFPAKYRIGLSATPERSDGGDRVFYWHIGPLKVRSEARSMPLDVLILNFQKDPSFKMFGRGHGPRVKSLTMNSARNRMMVDEIKRMYRANRQILVIGEHVAHLQTLMGMCAHARIPRKAMGQYTGSRHVRELHTDPKTKRVSMKKVGEKKVSDAEYEHVKNTARVIFATYGVFKEGIDIPRLDAGIDVTPTSKAKQVVGRIRRVHPNKPKPVWITVRDIGDPMFEAYFEKRMVDYEGIGARVRELN